jgi:hypothetical protein
MEIHKLVSFGFFPAIKQKGFLRKKRSRDLAGPLGFRLKLPLGRFDVGCLGAFFALAKVIFYRLTLLQCPESFGGNLGVMDKHVLAAVIRNDETEPLLLVEPLYFACTHVNLLETLTTDILVVNQQAPFRGLLKRRFLRPNSIAENSPDFNKIPD